jgi:hypothetical protein
MTSSVRGSFTGTTNGNPIDTASDVDLVVSGTFVASVQLQTTMANPSGGADVWVPVGAVLTAPGVLNVKMTNGRKWRAICSAFTSGQADYELSGAMNQTLRSSP